MASSRITLLVLLFFLQAICSASLGQCPSIEELSKLSPEACDTLSLNDCDELHLLIIMGAAEGLIHDTSQVNQIKGSIWMSILADELQRRGKGDKNFDPLGSEVIRLQERLGAYQYHIALVTPGDFDKLVQYLIDGRAQYVIKRFFDRRYHIYYLVLEFMVFNVILLFGWLKKKRALDSFNQKTES